MIETYFSLGDSLAMDPLLAETPITPGASAIVASQLARNHRLQKYKNFCRERSRMSSIWLNQLPSILASRGQVIVTISTGLEDMVDMGLEYPYKGQIHSAVHDSVSAYGRLVRTLRRLLPHALIVGTAVPDPTFGTGHFEKFKTPFPSSGAILFNDLLKEYASRMEGFVFADVFDELSEPEAWASTDNIQLSSKGCKAIANTWLSEILKSGLIQEREVA